MLLFRSAMTELQLGYSKTQKCYRYQVTPIWNSLQIRLKIEFQSQNSKNKLKASSISITIFAIF